MKPPSKQQVSQYKTVKIWQTQDRLSRYIVGKLTSEVDTEWVRSARLQLLENLASNIDRINKQLLI